MRWEFVRQPGLTRGDHPPPVGYVTLRWMLFGVVMLALVTLNFYLIFALHCPDCSAHARACLSPPLLAGSSADGASSSSLSSLPQSARSLFSQLFNHASSAPPPNSTSTSTSTSTTAKTLDRRPGAHPARAALLDMRGRSFGPARLPAPSEVPPTPAPSINMSALTWPPPSIVSKPMFSLTETHNAILNHYAKLTDHIFYNYTIHSTYYMQPKKLAVSTISDSTLENNWRLSGIGEKYGAYILHCAQFDPYCASMTESTLQERYNLYYEPPRYYPNASEAVRLYNGPKPGRSLASAITKDGPNGTQVKNIRVGANLAPPTVLVVYDGWITKSGSILSKDIWLPLWPDQTNNFTRYHAETLLPLEQPSPKPSPSPGVVNRPHSPVVQIVWKEVKEVLVVSHVHQLMFWHWMMGELYRIHPLIPYLQAHPQIYIHMGVGLRKLEWAFVNLFNISSERIIAATYVKAEIIYYSPFISRDDVPSLGLTQVIANNVWNALGIPADQRVSVLSRRPLDAAAAAGTKIPEPDVYNVSIMCIVRTNPYKARMIANYAELQQALAQFAVDYPLKIKKLAPACPPLNISLSEHLPNMTIDATFDIFARADVIIGPHGAGFANLMASRPGAHVIELMTGRHLNVLTTARKGMVYHGVVTAQTRNGTAESARDPNWAVDVPLVLSIIESAFDYRFLPQATERAA